MESIRLRPGCVTGSVSSACNACQEVCYNDRDTARGRISSNLPIAMAWAGRGYLPDGCEYQPEGERMVPRSYDEFDPAEQAMVGALVSAVLELERNARNQFLENLEFHLSK